MPPDYFIGYFSTGYFPEDWWPDPFGSGVEVTGVVDAVLPAIRCSARGRTVVLGRPVSGGISTYVPTTYRTAKVRAELPAIIASARGEVGVAGEVRDIVPMLVVSGRGKAFALAGVIGDIRVPMMLCESRGVLGVSGSAEASIVFAVDAKARFDMFSDKDIEEIAAFLMVA